MAVRPSNVYKQSNIFEYIYIYIQIYSNIITQTQDKAHRWAHIFWTRGNLDWPLVLACNAPKDASATPSAPWETAECGMELACRNAKFGWSGDPGIPSFIHFATDPVLEMVLGFLSSAVISHPLTDARWAHRSECLRSQGTHFQNADTIFLDHQIVFGGLKLH